MHRCIVNVLRPQGLVYFEETQNFSNTIPSTMPGRTVFQISSSMFTVHHYHSCILYLPRTFPSSSLAISLTGNIMSSFSYIVIRKLFISCQSSWGIDIYLQSSIRRYVSSLLCRGLTLQLQFAMFHKVLSVIG